MKLLVIDTSYNFQAIKEKKLYEAIYSRDLDGYFKKVWSVHPFASISLNSDQKKKFGKLEIFKINNRHFFIEGKFGRFFALRKLKIINFLFSQLEIFFFLKKLIKDENIDYIKSHDPHYNSLLAYLLSKVTRIPFLLRVSGNFDKIFDDTKKPIVKNFFVFRSIEKTFERFIFKKANFVIAPNNDNLEYAFNNGLKRSKGEVVRYGSLIYKDHLTNPQSRKEKYFFSKELNLDDRNIYLIYVGRLEKVKRVMDLIPIMKNIGGTEVKLLIVGKGSLENEIKKAIVSNNLTKTIFLLGEKNQEWLSRCLPNCSCFLATHTGRALAEASFAGLPIVGYDIDWHSEIIKHGFNGYLAKTDDHLSFSNLILKIVKDKDLSERFSINLREKAETLLSPKKITEVEIECFNKLKKG
tara:strand:+ start:1452 stop:2681 length:1230 start_codon:yes stop_codon:yes gene_type:complete